MKWIFSFVVLSALGIIVPLYAQTSPAPLNGWIFSGTEQGSADTVYTRYLPRGSDTCQLFGHRTNITTHTAVTWTKTLSRSYRTPSYISLDVRLNGMLPQNHNMARFWMYIGTDSCLYPVGRDPQEYFQLFPGDTTWWFPPEFLMTRVGVPYFNTVKLVFFLGFPAIDGMEYVFDNLRACYGNGPILDSTVIIDKFGEQQGAASVEYVPGNIPSGFSLAQNYPNPFNPTTVIGFTVPEAADLSLIVYSLLGTPVQILAEGQFAPGTYRAVVNATLLASGPYFYQLRTNRLVMTRKMLLVR